MMKKVGQFLWARKWLVAGIAIVALISWRVWQQKQTQTPTYTTTTAQYRDLEQTLPVSGSVDAYEKVTLKFPAAAKLAWVGVKEGDTVKKYQAIATLDTATLEKQLQADLNSFAKQFITHDQTLDTYDAYTNPSLTLDMKRILEKAQYDLDNAVITVEIQNLAIKLRTLVSPIAGIVTNADQPYAGVNVGVTDGYTIVNPDTIYFGMVVDEADIAQVKQDQSANLVLDAYPNDSIPTSVTKIDFASSPSESGGTGYKVYLTMPEGNNDLKYRLGMSGTADIILAQKSHVLSIPLDSLITRDNTNYVDVLVNGKTERKELTIGIETNDYVEVVSGLTENDQVVVPTS